MSVHHDALLNGGLEFGKSVGECCGESSSPQLIHADVRLFTDVKLHPGKCEAVGFWCHAILLAHSENLLRMVEFMEMSMTTQ